MATIQVIPQNVQRSVPLRRTVARKLHLYIGLTASLVLLIIAGTGMLLAFREPIDRLLNRKLTHVEPTGQSMALSKVLEGLAQQYPGARFLQLNLPETRDSELDVVLQANDKSIRQLAVDPYTGKVLGDWVRDGNQLMDIALRLHKGLLLVPGDGIAKFASLAMLFMSVTGVILWAKRPKMFPMLGVGNRIFNRELHSSIGFYSCLLLFVFSLTGIFPRGLFMKFPRFQPSDRKSAHGNQLSPEQWLAAAMTAVPGATPVTIRLPRKVEENVLVTLRYANDHTPIGRTAVQLDPYTGAPIKVVSTEKMTSMERFCAMYDMEIHAGTIGGTATRAIAGLSSLAMMLLAVTGPIIWWQSRPVRRASQK